MKIRDTRDGRTFEGELVAMLPPNEEPPDEAVRRFYKIGPGDKHYDVVKRAQPLPRMVLQRVPDDDDPSYYIIPRYDFYEEVKG